MKVDIEEINSTKRALRIELPPQSLLDKLEAAYRHLAKEVRLPGFRPGKVPRECLREQAGEYVPRDGWPALREDRVVVDYEALLGSKPLKGVSGQNVSILLGARQFIPEFEEQLHGLKKGEGKEFPIEFPADHARRGLAGKRAPFRGG